MGRTAGQSRRAAGVIDMETDFSGTVDRILALFSLPSHEEILPIGIPLMIRAVPILIGALPVTLQLLVISLAIGFCLAVPIALARLSRNPLLWMPAYAYIYFFRGTPLLIQLYLIYYGSGQFREFWESIGLWWFFKDAWWPCIAALSLNTAGYTAEILRGAILGVPHGEVEAAKACGMSGLLLFRRITFPKALRLALPAYSNEVILMLQATSLASLVTIYDMMRTADIIYNRTYAVYEMYITVGAMYLALTYLLVWGFRSVEFRLSGHLRERPGMATAGVVAMPAGLR
jgi:octopine/nopaline transport system permease protein/arginine/ornithine transport system permease protein